jgi:DNA-binding NtrC family response regulator
VLVVDDDALLRRSLCDALAARGLATLSAARLDEALALATAHDVDVVLLDEQLPDGRGHTLCPRLLAGGAPLKIVFMTAFPEFEHAVTAIRAGAFDYLCKPFELEALFIAVDHCIQVLELERVERREAYRQRRDTDGVVLVGDSPAFAEVRAVVDVAAASDASVLVTGETGTGKSLVAKAIHARGPRRGRAFVPLSCANLPDNLVEAELFGWERGAFTGAVATHDGAFGMADGGTLFLDEIGEMPLHLQPKLLAALEDGVVRRIGGRAGRAVDVRIVAATNADLATLVEERRFRSDLYYRLDVVRIHLPPLRERAEDIPALARHLLAGLAGRRATAELDDAEAERLAAYAWPGNVRELRNVLERAILLQPGRLRPSELLRSARSFSPAGGTPAQRPSAASSSSRLVAVRPEPTAVAGAEVAPLADVERQQIAAALERTGGNLAQAARLLGISLSTLKRRVKDGGAGSVPPSRRGGSI